MIENDTSITPGRKAKLILQAAAVAAKFTDSSAPTTPRVSESVQPAPPSDLDESERLRRENDGLREQLEQAHNLKNIAYQLAAEAGEALQILGYVYQARDETGPRRWVPDPDRPDVMPLPEPTQHTAEDFAEALDQGDPGPDPSDTAARGS